MIAKTFTAAAAALALTATPVLAQETEIDRAPAQVDVQAEQDGRHGPGLLLAVLALAAIIGAIIIAVGDDDEDLPTSP
ncbi:MAG: hypothetical protein WBA68_10930 [Alteraurantiacibacter sp.]